MLDIVLALLVFIGTGYVAGMAGILTSLQSRSFSRFVFYVSLPALVLALFGRNDVLGHLEPGLLLLTIAPMLALTLLFVFLRRFVGDRTAATLIIVSVMPSSTFVGFPVIKMLLGEAGMEYALILGPLHLVYTMIFAAPIAAVLAGGKFGGYSGTAKKILIHPIILAIILGILLNLAGARLPEFLESPLDSIGSSTVPVALFSMGLFMAGVKLKTDKLKLSLILSAARLFPYALIVLALAPVFGIAGTALSVSLLLAMMPIAVLTFVLSEEYGLDSEAVAFGLVITTLLLPLPIYLVQYLV